MADVRAGVRVGQMPLQTASVFRTEIRSALGGLVGVVKSKAVLECPPSQILECERCGGSKHELRTRDNNRKTIHGDSVCPRLGPDGGTISGGCW